MREVLLTGIQVVVDKELLECPTPGIYTFILFRSKGYGVDRLVAWRGGSKPTYP